MACNERIPADAGPPLRLVMGDEQQPQPMRPGNVRFTVEGDPAAVAEFIRALAAKGQSPEPTATSEREPLAQESGREMSARCTSTSSTSLIDLYAQERSGDCSAQHVVEVRNLLRDLLAHAGQVDPLAITRQHVVDFLHYCETVGRPHPTGRRRQKCGPKTRRSMLTALRVFYEWVIHTHNGDAVNPCATVRSPKITRRQMRAFSPTEAAAMIANAKSLERSVLYRILWVSGARVGAIAGQKGRNPLPDWCFETGANPPRIIIPPEFSKTGVGYTCALDAETAAMIERVRAAKGPDHAPSLPLFKRPRPKAFFGDVRRAKVPMVDERGRRAGLHCFRRGSATGMLDLGLDAKTAQLQLGHSDVATTLRHYTDRGLKEQGAAAELLARAIGCRQSEQVNP